MIKRIVKMSFVPEKIEDFKSIFENNWQYIKGFKGFISPAHYST